MTSLQKLSQLLHSVFIQASTTISFITALIIFPSLNQSALFLSLPVSLGKRHPLYIIQSSHDKKTRGLQVAA